MGLTILVLRGEEVEYLERKKSNELVTKPYPNIGDFIAYFKRYLKILTYIKWIEKSAFNFYLHE